MMHREPLQTVHCCFCGSSVLRGAETLVCYSRKVRAPTEQGENSILGYLFQVTVNFAHVTTGRKM